MLISNDKDLVLQFIPFFLSSGSHMQHMHNCKGSLDDRRISEHDFLKKKKHLFIMVVDYVILKIQINFILINIFVLMLSGCHPS